MSLFCKHQDEELNRYFGFEQPLIPYHAPFSPATLITSQCLKCERFKQKRLQGHVPRKGYKVVVVKDD